MIFCSCCVLRSGAEMWRGLSFDCFNCSCYESHDPIHYATNAFSPSLVFRYCHINIFIKAELVASHMTTPFALSWCFTRRASHISPLKCNWLFLLGIILDGWLLILSFFGKRDEPHGILTQRHPADSLVNYGQFISHKNIQIYKHTLNG